MRSEAEIANWLSKLDKRSEFTSKFTSEMKEHYILQFFDYKHLPEKLQSISKPFCDLAYNVAALIPDNPERTAALRKLLESKDCAVRAELLSERKDANSKIL